MMLAIKHPNGPGDRRMFWWNNEPYHLSKLGFRIMATLWAAPEYSLPITIFVQVVWGNFIMDEVTIHKLRQRVSAVGKALKGSGIFISTKNERVFLIF